jgi:phage FluMu gp28-like protein
VSERDAPFREYAQLYAESLTDEVQFARRFLGFQPFQYQEEFLRDRSKLIAACCGRQVGKTTLAAIKALHFVLAYPNKQVLIVSAGMRQSMILFSKITELINQSFIATTLLTEGTKTMVKFANRSQIVALPCGRDGSTLRGFTSDLAILDEANFIPQIVIDSVIRPTTITKPDARIIMLSTPWARDHPFYHAVTKPELGFKAYRWPTSINPLVTKENLELERKTVSEYEFDREYNANFVDDQFTYFPSKLVLECTDDYPLNPEPRTGERPNGNFYCGVDFGMKTDHSAIAIVQEQQDHSLRLVYLKQIPLETPYSTVIEHIRRLNTAYQFRGGYVDQSGVGEPPYEEIKRFAPQIKGIVFTERTKQDILSNLLLTMEHVEVTIPREPQQLLTQLTQQRCEPTPRGTYKFSHPSGTHDDLAWAFALSVYAYPGDLSWMTELVSVRRPD